MTNRRVDAIHFFLVLAVACVGYVAVDRFSLGESGMSSPPGSPQPLRFKTPFEPFELPFHSVKLESASPPGLVLPGNMESALVEVRATPLESSTLVEVRPAQRILASVE